jgi:hypothetical protein
VGRRMRWVRSPGVGAMAPSRRLALRVTTKSAVPSSRPKDQELFAFLAGGERLVAARQRCDRRHRAAALAATAGRRGDPAHQTRTRGVRPAGGPVPCTGVRQNRALAEHLIRTAHAACREPEAPQRPVASWYLKARDLVWSRQRHGKWPERTGVRDAVVRPVPVTELPGLPQGVQKVGFSALIAIRSRARRERQLLALTRRCAVPVAAGR